MTAADPLPPLADPAALVRAMAKLQRRLAADLLERAGDARVEPSLRQAWTDDQRQGRTGEGFESYRDAFCDQVAASWIVCAVFARTLEDRGYVPHRIAGPGAADRQAQFRAQFRYLGDRDYLLHLFDALALLPGGKEIFGPGHAPLWRLGPSTRAIGELVAELRAAEAGVLRFSFGRGERDTHEHDGASTRYLGDLYQDLNENVRKRFALLQTPEFVERFLLDHSLAPAIRERGIAVTVLDPACGSGHLLLGAYDRLFEARRRVEPGLPEEASARTALGQVYGVDINPYAAAITRFRLLLSYLDKARIPKLAQVSTELPFHVHVGDSLLAGVKEVQRGFGDVLAERGGAVGSYDDKTVFSFVDAETDKLLRWTRFDVVVANPPYITEKDAKKRDLIRDRYKAASGKFALSAPFAERIFQLGNDGGFTGQITSNSFMKREFGKALINEVLPNVDLTEVLDTSGAYIPGHGTPTVILVARSRGRVGSRVRVVMGSRGEPSTPDVPAEGKVWSAIAAHHNEIGYADEYISVVEVEREKLAQHPWSLGGGGAAELKDLLEDRAQKRLSELVDSIGISSFTLEDDVYMAPLAAHRARGLSPRELRPMVEGDIVRDWSLGETSSAVFPYDAEFQPHLTPSQNRYLWPWRTSIASNVLFGGKTKVQGGLKWYEFGRLTGTKLKTPLSIVFAEVTTHNHFVLDRGGKVFKQTAPIIKLPEGATEEEHLALLGYLNSSTACFWMRQMCHCKGSQGINEGIKSEKWEQFFQFSGTTLGRLAILPGVEKLLPLAGELDHCARQLDQYSPRRILHPSGPAALSAARERRNALFARMVFLQEELDWTCYGLAGLPTFICEQTTGKTMRPEERTFEFVMAQAPDADQNTWFLRHERKPVRRVSPTMPDDLLAVHYQRIDLLKKNPSTLGILESPEYKRRWDPFDWAKAVTNACEDHLLTAAEASTGASKAVSVRQIAQILNRDPKIRAVAEVLTGTTTYDLEALLGDLLQNAAVASATCQRYTDAGIEKRRAWERTWELQREEDAGKTVTIAVPPKYDQKDFENAAVVWRHRGKLDVPKERFIAYPTATPPPGATGKAGLVFGWAGWNHLEQLQAAIALWQDEFGQHGHRLVPRATRVAREEDLGPGAADDEALREDTAAREKLMPILQTMVDLLPWVRQWHDEDKETAGAFEAYVSEQPRRLEVSLEEAHLYRRPARAAKSAGRPRAAAAAPARAAVTAVTADEVLALVRELDTGDGAAASALGERLGLAAPALKKALDGLVAAGQLTERKKRPRLVSCTVARATEPEGSTA